VPHLPHIRRPVVPGSTHANKTSCLRLLTRSRCRRPPSCCKRSHCSPSECPLYPRKRTCLTGGILPAMWHPEPKNDAWREVHLAHVESLGNRLWLRCNACGHSITPDPREFAHQHHLDMKTPLLLIAKRLKCTHCNERKAHCWPEPYGIEMKG